MTTGTIGTAKLNLSVDTSEFTAQIQGSRSLASSLGQEAQRAFSEAQGGARRASESLLRYVQGLQNGVDEQKLLNAAIKGVPIAIIQEARNAILAQRDATAQAAAEQQRLAQAARVAAEAQAQHARQQSTRTDFLNSLQQQVVAIGKTKAELLELRAAELGVSASAAPLIAQLKAQEVALNGNARAAQVATREVNQYGLSQKQVVAAMRGVPAQITDIFISLQGGQNPLTVLLQQGGQLKDMFGGLVPAVRALAGALAGLINPWTVAAAAIGVFVAGIVSAEKRLNGFNQALIFTGQSVPGMAESLQDSANALDQISSITSREAADALTQVAATGKIAANQYELIARAAIAMSDVTGKAVSETVAEYAQLATDPLNAVMRLNEAEQFLTRTQLDRIRQLQESGQIEEAAAVASEARAQAQIERAAEAVENLGLVTGAWHSIKNETGEAWDEAVNYFANLDREAKDAANTLKNLWSSFRIGGPGGAFGAVGALSGAPNVDPQKAAKMNMEAERQLAAIVQGNLSREEQQKREITRIENLGVAAGWERVKIQEAIAASNKKYQESLPKGRNNSESLANAQRSAALQAIKDQLEIEQAAIQSGTRLLQAQYAARAVTTEEYYTRQRALIEQGGAAEERALQKQIAYLKGRNDTGKTAIDVSRQLGEAEAKLAAVRRENSSALEILATQEQAALDKRKRAVEAYRDSLIQANEAARESFDASIRRITMGDREAEIADKLAQINADAADKQRQLARDLAENGDQALYDQRLAALQEFTDSQVDIVQDGYERMKEAQSDWVNGLNSGLKNWIDQASNAAAQASQITANTLNGLVDTLHTFATTGKSTFKSFLADVASDISKFMIRKAVLQFVQYFAGMMGGGGGAGGAVNPVGGATNMGPNQLPGYALGGAFPGSPNLSSYSGQVVNRPTPFYFASGAGVMGEAGWEGILPLKRGSDGKLGVSAQGGGSGPVTVNVITNVEGGSATTEVQTTGQQTDDIRRFTQAMENIAKQTVVRETMPGGTLWKMGVRS